MAVTDLTNTTWIFKDTITASSSSTTSMNLTFKCGSMTCYKLIYSSTGIWYELDGSAQISVYTSSTGWAQESFKTIEILSGTDVTNSTLISWLKSTAKQVLPSPDDKNLVTYESLNKFKEKLNHIILSFSGGLYDGAKQYAIADSCYYDRHIYICKVACKGILPTNTTYWDLLVDYTPKQEAALCTNNIIICDADGYGLVVEGQEAD